MGDERKPDDLPESGFDRYEYYEKSGKLVIYDSKNPLAWIQSDKWQQMDRMR